ncbi:hypothetical protein [Millisia brevis]|uniref:hypothetical protein n=1 Tax=Millisia brevis TaxID=264148 RepID=UPI0012EE7295|nr:hypothetical protein [Millisia brevis]
MSSLRLLDPASRADLVAFLGLAQRLDEAAVVRMHRRTPEQVVAWVQTGFDVLACRALPAELSDADAVAAVDQVAAAADAALPGAQIDLGFPMDSSWRGALPPVDGFRHVDDVPAELVLELARSAGDLSREYKTGPPQSLLDQHLMTVDDHGRESIGIPARVMLALTAMRFVPEHRSGEFVRVRAHPAWLRVDARYGSVYRRRASATPLIIGT